MGKGTASATCGGIRIRACVATELKSSVLASRNLPVGRVILRSFGGVLLRVTSRSGGESGLASEAISLLHSER